MTTIVTAADLAHIQSTYPYLNVKPLTPQQERFILFLLRGLSVTAAERAVGYASGYGRNLLKEEHVQKILEYYKEHEFKDIRVSRDTLTTLLFEAHAKSATATEEIAAIRELGKMHDVYESDKRKGINVNTNIVNITNAKQVERLDDAQLLELAGFTSLDPVPTAREPVTIDVEAVHESNQ